MIWKQCFPELSFACLLHWLSSAKRETGLYGIDVPWCIMKHCSWVPQSLAEVKWRWERWLHACSCQKLDIQCRLLTAGQVNSLKVWTLYKNIGASCDCVIGLNTQIRLFLNTEELLGWCGFHYKGKRCWEEFMNGSFVCTEVHTHTLYENTF